MDPPSELEGYAGMEALEEGQQIILELPQEGEAGSDSVIMEVVSVDGNQIHFIAPDKFSMGEVGLSGKYAITEDSGGLSDVTGSAGGVKFTIPGVGEGGAARISLPEVGPAKFGAGAVPETSAIGEEVEEIRMPDVGSIQDDDTVVAVTGQEGLESEASAGKDKLAAGGVGGGTAEELGTEREGGEVVTVDPLDQLSGPVTGDEDEASGDEQGELEEVPTPTCFLCRRPAAVITYLLRGRTASCACSLAERLSSCLAPVKLSFSTADAVCTGCQALINTADAHYFQFKESSREISALLVQGAEPHPGILSKPEPAEEPVETEVATMQPPLLVPANYRPKRRKPSPRGDGDDSADSDWTPSREGSPPRTSRGRRPKTRCVWSPEPRPAAPPGKRRPGRPRKHPVVDLNPQQVAPPPPAAPKVIEYTDLETLKQRVKDIKTKKFSMNPFPRTLKSDLEKIIHLEVRAVDDLSAPDDGEEPPPPEREKSPGRTATLRTSNTYECRRCNIEFQDSDEMVKHLRQHVSKPWCKRCRTEFPNRPALLDHRRACRLQHRAGICSICNKEVPYHRYHMKRHAELVEEGRLMEGEPLPEDEDGPPPSLQRASGKLLAGGVCSICGEHVATRLRKHERSHSATNTCPICKKVFARDDVVRGHISRVHLKERPHVCPQCGKTFVSVFSLQRHEMIHNNEYRFYCQECGDGFRQKQQLTAHMRHKHGVLDVVFEDVQVMPEGTAVVDAMSVVADSGVELAGGVLEALDDKGEFVIAAAGSGDEGDEVRYTVTDAAGRMYRVATADAEALAQE